jgi:CBS domain-containing protein
MTQQAASPSTSSAHGAWEGPAKVRDLMTANVATVGAQESVGFALELMLWRAVRHLPVMDHGELVGVISDRDLITRPRADGVAGMHRVLVREVMSTEVESTHPGDDAALAAARMVERRINCLLVLEGDALVGILTSTDVLAERGRLFLKAGKGDVPGAHTFMTKDPAFMRPDDKVLDAVLQMSRLGVRHLPIVDEGGRVVGMLSERNLRSAVGTAALALARPGGDLADYTLRDAMTYPPAVCGPDASLFELADHFVDERVGAVAVVDTDDRLVGIVSYVDMLRFLLGEGET